MYRTGPWILALLLLSFACKTEKINDDQVLAEVVGTPYELNLPSNMPPMDIPEGNPLTEEKVELGRFLFYDKMLSEDGEISCSSCHKQEFAFSDAGEQFSKGVYDQVGDMNSMSLQNIGWQESFFWDGRETDLEEQSLKPMENPIEMHGYWGAVLVKLADTDRYPAMFEKAFGDQEITKERAAMAIASFMRVLNSTNSKYDKWRRNEPDVTFTTEEHRGFQLFFSAQGRCYRCHDGNNFHSTLLHNTGLDSVWTGVNEGHFKWTGDSLDLGRFKSPSLRNVEVTAPYMHDGRLATLDEVIDHYDEDFHETRWTDPWMGGGGWFPLTEPDKHALVAFLKTLTDHEFLTDSRFSDPFEE